MANTYVASVFSPGCLTLCVPILFFSPLHSCLPFLPNISFPLPFLYPSLVIDPAVLWLCVLSVSVSTSAPILLHLHLLSGLSHYSYLSLYFSLALRLSALYLHLLIIHNMSLPFHPFDSPLPGSTSNVEAPVPLTRHGPHENQQAYAKSQAWDLII